MTRFSVPPSAEFTPPWMIAMSVEDVGAAPFEIAWNAAAQTVGTERVHIIWSQHAGRVWLLAGPSTDFTTCLDPVTKLASALPGMAGHQGDGAYMYNAVNTALAVVKDGAVLACYANEDRLQLLAAVRKHAVPLYQIEEVGQPAPWQSYLLGEERRNMALRSKIARCGAVALTVSFLAMVGAGFLNFAAETLLGARQAAATANLDALRVNLAGYADQAAPRQMEAFHAVLGDLPSGAVLQLYRMEGDVVSQVIHVPAWTPADIVSRLAAGGTVTKMVPLGTAETVLVITKGKAKQS